MKTKLLLSTVVASLLLSSSALFASSYHDSVATKEAKAVQNPSGVKGEAAAKAAVEEANSKEAFLAKVNRGEFKQEVNQEENRRLQKIVNFEAQTHKNSLKKAPKEFMNGLNETISALQALQANKTKEAQTALESATKQFDIALKANPKLGLIPIADKIEVITFNGDAKLIKHIKESAEKLLKENDTQVAIDLLVPLQDEMVIRTQLVPAYLYPKATKEAAKTLKAGKTTEAFKILMTALSATEIHSITIPIPLITAQDMVLQASKLEKSHKKEALKLLSQAEDELQKAVLLGYTHEYAKSYKAINEQIEALKTEIKGKNIVEKLYEKLLKSFKDLDNKHQHDVKNSAK